MQKSYYITTTLPYVNADPHIGFALEIIQADVLARYHRLLGEQVIFSTGTDEHGLKIYRKALAEKKEPQAYCDEYAAKFEALQQALNLSYTNFIRTTDKHHVAAAQEFWRRCFKNGDIYKKNYQIRYCVGCELEKTDSELENGCCLIHPKLKLEMIEEENYFFRWSKYQAVLLNLYKQRPDFVVPKNRLQEIKNFVAAELQDFSISRLKKKMPWGVSVPDDSEQVMYVWFDALINYISALGWFKNKKKFEKFWPGVQVAGKDNLRQQSAMWQAMLLSAGLPPSKQIFIHGFITAEGQKMSKSLGNVVDPYGVVKKYGTDPTRYYLLGSFSSYEDGDFSEKAFAEWYETHLANGIGNLTARVITMLEKYCGGKIPAKANDVFGTKTFWQTYEQSLAAYRFDEAVRVINEFVGRCDFAISQSKPWEKVRRGENIQPLLYQLAEALRHIALSLVPVLPETGKKILAQLGIKISQVQTLAKEKKWGRMKKGMVVRKGKVLFPRLCL